MPNQLQKVINLAKKTGDRIIVFDPDQEDKTYVVMPLEEYEDLVVGKSEVRNLTEEELLDKINRNIAVWKTENESEIFNDNNFYSADTAADISRTEEKIEDIHPYEQENFASQGRSSFEKIENILPEKNRFSRTMNNNWKIPSMRKQAAEEIIEEDRQYLEEV